MNEDSRERRLQDALRGCSTTKKANSEPTISISARDGIAIGNNNNIIVLNTRQVVHQHIIDPTGGELTPAQKQHISQLVDGVVAASHDGGSPTTHQAVWKRFQRNFKVNTYHALPADQYDRALKYLRMLYGRAKKGEL